MIYLIKNRLKKYKNLKKKVGAPWRFLRNMHASHTHSPRQITPAITAAIITASFFLLPAFITRNKTRDMNKEIHLSYLLNIQSINQNNSRGMFVLTEFRSSKADEQHVSSNF